MNKVPSLAGNQTRVFCVTGGDTHHYTTEDWLAMSATFCAMIYIIMYKTPCMMSTLFFCCFLAQ